jgi:hypothetical protein
MLIKAAAIWVFGLLTAVPAATYYLFFHAPRDRYAVLITFVLFWIFGFWGVVGPLLAAIKTRRVFRAIENASSVEQLLEISRSPEARDAAIDLIASENHIPRFLARRVYGLLVDTFSSEIGSRSAPAEVGRADNGKP